MSEVITQHSFQVSNMIAKKETKKNLKLLNKIQSSGNKRKLKIIITLSRVNIVSSSKINLLRRNLFRK